MAKKIDIMKRDIIGEIFSQTELENYMSKYEFVLIETDDELDGQDNMIKFTNYKSQIWIEGEFDDDGNILVSALKGVSKISNEPTRVEPFRTYEDLEKVLNYFKENKMYHHWLTSWLMAAMGRRVGDTVSFKWSDLFLANGEYRERLNTLKEEKTGKVVGVRLNALARLHISEYCEIMKINPMEHYNEKIIRNTEAAFRKALKKAIKEAGLTYKISTHSFRKFYGDMIYKLHPQDADNLTIVQSMFGQSSPEITKLYIGEIDRKIDKYNEDFSEYMINRVNGICKDISNSPILSIKAEDFRNILSKCWDMAKNGTDKFDGISELIGMAEKCVGQ